jgi:hypothetical protein
MLHAGAEAPALACQPSNWAFTFIAWEYKIEYCYSFPSKGSIGHNFLFIICTEHHNQVYCLAFSSTKGF